MVQPKVDTCLSSASHFSPLTCRLSVVLQPDKGDYRENSRVVFCPNKERSFEPFICLDLHGLNKISFTHLSQKFNK